MQISRVDPCEGPSNNHAWKTSVKTLSFQHYLSLVIQNHFVRSFVRAFVCSFVLSIARSSTRSFVFRSFVRSSARSFVRSLVRYFIRCSFVRSFPCSFVRSFRSFIRSLVRSLVDWFVRSSKVKRLAFSDVYPPSKNGAVFVSKVHQSISAAIISLHKERIDTQSIVVWRHGFLQAV